MRTIAILQARMRSSRLPGKVLMPVRGMPLLQIQIERLRRDRRLDRIGVATTDQPADDELVRFAESLGLPVFRGSEGDVLSRFAGAARAWQAEIVVRLTGDCPLIDPKIVDRVVEAFQERSGLVDYVSNVLERTYPRGMDTEVFRIECLAQADREARDPAEREHVTPFIYRHPERFRLFNVCHSTDEGARRWTVDTPEDFELIRRILESLLPVRPEFSLEDILDLMRQHPDWEALNRHVRQKDFAEESR